MSLSRALYEASVCSPRGNNTSPLALSLTKNKLNLIVSVPDVVLTILQYVHNPAHEANCSISPSGFKSSEDREHTLGKVVIHNFQLWLQNLTGLIKTVKYRVSFVASSLEAINIAALADPWIHDIDPDDNSGNAFLLSGKTMETLTLATLEILKDYCVTNADLSLHWCSEGVVPGVVARARQSQSVRELKNYQTVICMNDPALVGVASTLHVDIIVNMSSLLWPKAIHVDAHDAVLRLTQHGNLPHHICAELGVQDASFSVPHMYALTQAADAWWHTKCRNESTSRLGREKYLSTLSDDAAVGRRLLSCALTLCATYPELSEAVLGATVPVELARAWRMTVATEWRAHAGHDHDQEEEADTEGEDVQWQTAILRGLMKLRPPSPTAFSVTIVEKGEVKSPIYIHEIVAPLVFSPFAPSGEPTVVPNAHTLHPPAMTDNATTSNTDRRLRQLQAAVVVACEQLDVQLSQHTTRPTGLATAVTTFTPSASAEPVEANMPPQIAALRTEVLPGVLRALSPPTTQSEGGVEADLVAIVLALLSNLPREVSAGAGVAHTRNEDAGTTPAPLFSPADLTTLRGFSEALQPSILALYASLRVRACSRPMAILMFLEMIVTVVDAQTPLSVPRLDPEAFRGLNAMRRLVIQHHIRTCAPAAVLERLKNSDAAHPKRFQAAVVRAVRTCVTKPVDRLEMCLSRLNLLQRVRASCAQDKRTEANMLLIRGNAHDVAPQLPSPSDAFLLPYNAYQAWAYAEHIRCAMTNVRADELSGVLRFSPRLATPLPPSTDSDIPQNHPSDADVDNDDVASITPSQSTQETHDSPPPPPAAAPGLTFFTPSSALEGTSDPDADAAEAISEEEMELVLSCCTDVEAPGAWAQLTHTEAEAGAVTAAVEHVFIQCAKALFDSDTALGQARSVWTCCLGLVRTA